MKQAVKRRVSQLDFFSWKFSRKKEEECVWESCEKEIEVRELTWVKVVSLDFFLFLAKKNGWLAWNCTHTHTRTCLYTLFYFRDDVVCVGLLALKFSRWWWWCGRWRRGSFDDVLLEHAHTHTRTTAFFSRKRRYYYQSSAQFTCNQSVSKTWVHITFFPHVFPLQFPLYHFWRSGTVLKMKLRRCPCYIIFV